MNQHVICAVAPFGAVDIGLQERRIHRALNGSKTGYKVVPSRFMVRPLRALPHKHRASRGSVQDHGEHYNSPSLYILQQHSQLKRPIKHKSLKSDLMMRAIKSASLVSSWSITITLLAVCIGVIADRGRALVHQKRITGAYKKVTRRYDKRLSQHVQRHRYRYRVAIIAR